MKHLIIAVLWLGLMPSLFFASTATCTWQSVTLYTDGSAITTPVSYNIYRALKSDLTDAVLIGTASSLTFVDRSAPRKKACYYFAKAVVNGKESARSAAPRFYTSKP